MKPFVTCSQMKLLEKLADESGLSYYQMMENAGTRAFELICGKYSGNPSCATITVLCGKGNNGGDGFVVARKFYEFGASVTIVLVDGEPVTADAVTNYELIKNKVQIVSVQNIDSIAYSDIIIDAIYGTGFHGELRQNGQIAARWINTRKSFIAALDIPSGLNGDALSIDTCDVHAVKAHCTITFHNKKPVHVQNFALEYCGEVLIADIGIDEEKFDI